MAPNIYTCGKEYAIPALDVLTYQFDSPYSLAQPDTKLHLSAANPHHYTTTASQLRLLKRIAFALRTTYAIGARGPGHDVVVACSAGQYLLPALFAAVIAAGGVYSAASPSFTAFELARQLAQAGDDTRLLVCSPETLAVGVEAAHMAGLPRTRVLLLSSDDGFSLRDDAAEVVRGYQELEWERITDVRKLQETCIVLLYSSGTTGPPKGVVITHYMLVSEHYIPTTQSKERAEAVLAALPPGTPLPEPMEYRTLAHLPPSHIAGLLGYMVNPTLAAGSVYWMPRFSFAPFLAYMKQFRVTAFYTVPSIFLLISKSPLVTDQFEHVLAAVTGAAPMGGDLQKSANRKLGKPGEVFISQTWGMSETTGAVTAMAYGDNDDTGSIAKVLPNVQLRLVHPDDDTLDVKDGEPGEYLIKGPMVTPGYYKNPQATEESFTKDGWYKTGDIGVHKPGTELFYIVDRKKEVIKYKGLQVAPAELEQLLISNPHIADAAVIGVQSEEEGTEVPRAYVVKGVVTPPEREITEQEVRDWVKERASHYKQLRGGVVFVEEIPKSAIGKILRRDLRDMVKKQMEEGKLARPKL